VTDQFLSSSPPAGADPLGMKPTIRRLPAACFFLVCAGRVPLVEAQRAMASDWIAAYGRFIAAID